MMRDEMAEEWKYVTLKSASHDNWCTGTRLNTIITAQWESVRVGEVRVNTTSPMPDHKGFKLQ